MKTKAILAFVVAGALSFTACTKKVDEKTLADVNQFGTDWTALGEKATNWSNELTATTTQTKEFAAKQTERLNSMTNPKDQPMKDQIAQSVQTANENAAKLEGMQNEFNTFKASWDETTKQFGEWKDKVMKGEINSEEAAKGIAEFQTKMATAQTQIEGWNTQYSAIKTATDQSMASAETTATPATETATPEKK